MPEILLKLLGGHIRQPLDRGRAGFEELVNQLLSQPVIEQHTDRSAGPNHRLHG